MLTDAQIDRYSRQIILPEVGGAGQERLLQARVTVIAETGDLTPALDYLAGAGVGTIHVDAAGGNGAASRIAADMRALNPEVRIETAPGPPDATLLVLAATDRVVEAARRANRDASYQGAIFARLGEPYLLAMLTSRPPCLRCAHPGLLAQPIARGASAAILAMAAAAETIKSLLAVAPQPSRLIEFSQYEARAKELRERSLNCPVCG